MVEFNVENNQLRTILSEWAQIKCFLLALLFSLNILNVRHLVYYLLSESNTVNKA